MWIDSRIEADVKTEIDIIGRILKEIAQLPKQQSMRILRYAIDYASNAKPEPVVDKDKIASELVKAMEAFKRDDA